MKILHVIGKLSILENLERPKLYKSEEQRCEGSTVKMLGSGIP